jgi:arylsulfatase A-like enzyme
MNGSTRWRLAASLAILVASLFAASCTDPVPARIVLTADSTLHLEEHLEAATVDGSEVPEERLRPVTWRFDSPDSAVRVTPWPGRGAARAEHIDGALRVALEEATIGPEGGGPYWAPLPARRAIIVLELSNWQREDWAEVSIQARASNAGTLAIAYNLVEFEPDTGAIVQHGGEAAALLADNLVHRYVFPVRSTGRGRWPFARSEWEYPWQQLVIGLWANEPLTVEILSVTATPKGEAFSSARAGVGTVERKGGIRRALYTHAPSRIEWSVRVPKEGRLDTGLAVFQEDDPVAFRVAVTEEGREREVLLEEQVAGPEWTQRSVDLSAFSGRLVQIALETEGTSPGAVCFWGAPTLSGNEAAGRSGGKGTRPSVIFYVIDGAGADWMSVYGYNRRTTPFLEELAREAVVFEQAYSNATWTKVSTPSFMTSLMYSAISPYRSFTDQVPEGVPTMAERFGAVGYQTGVFTSNPFAVTMSGLERGVDLVKVEEVEVQATSSELLHQSFFEWRETYPSRPYWAHFQTTDVHEPFRPPAPFAGLFIDPERRERYIEWDDELLYKRPESYEARGITVEQHALAQQALYDEGMAHQDHHLRRLVDRLKASDKWHNTILVIASDHGYPAGSHRYMPGLDFEAPIVHPYATRVPLLFVAPGRIAGGRRVATPVSMIDVMPTLLDLVGLPPLEVQQGRSLAPFLRGETAELAPRPVFIEKLGQESAGGSLVGTIGVIDGRWAASLLVQDQQVIPQESMPRHGDGLSAHLQRTEKLLLWNRETDPFMARSVHLEHPDLVTHYREMLEEQLEAHQALAQRFTPGEESPLTPEQLRTLRALGYI